MGNRKRQYQTGEASNFLTRKQAMKKLQLNLKDFRRLCILKGIHPREPRNRKRAQKGNLTTVQMLFYEKDIRFLLHEPIVHRFRDFRVFLRKLKKAKDKGNDETEQRLKDNRPKYTLDHIVRERYPTFIDAIRDLEDCLCLCFLFSNFPKGPGIPTAMIQLCRRLTVEFMHYVIESKSLRKVFVSIKGYYYQAEIVGQTVTWVVPHSFGFSRPQSVDLKLMSIFVEFYTTMLGFVNFRLFHSLNIKYPPTIAGGLSTEKPAPSSENNSEEGVENDYVQALNQSLARTVVNMAEDETVEIDHIPMNSDDPDKKEAALKEALELKQLQTLFKGLRFFLGREIPRDSIVFMIRAFGGEVSWDSTISAGATFDENDQSITHQLCDRPKESVDMKYALSRRYVQPQWIFDSINKRQLLPDKDYLVGAVLPPHLSPFVGERRVGEYVPPEEKGIEQPEADAADVDDSSSEQEEESNQAEKEEEEGEEEEEEEVSDDNAESKMKVEVGKAVAEDEAEVNKKMAEEEFKLRTMMIPKKHRRLHSSMMKSRKRRVFEAKQLTRKRSMIDAEEKRKKKLKKSSTDV